MSGCSASSRTTPSRTSTLSSATTVLIAMVAMIAPSTGRARLFETH
jgi:hypothetical protein